MSLIPRKMTATRYGVTVRTITNWALNPEMGFPPATLINRRLYDDTAALDAWDRDAELRAAAKARADMKAAAA